uniref:Zinc finger CCHC domain-containing protein 7 n=1 Tax=Anopheles dirus TaxID=7168 RepID=A0A182N8A0_9DIPT
DLEHRDLAALEERLYSSIHHSYQAPQTPQDAAPLPATSARVVSRTSVINNGQGTLPANMKRYWAGSAAPIPSERTPYVKNKPNDAAKQSAPSEPIQASENEPATTEGGRKMFLTPYQSLLGITNPRSSDDQSAQPIATFTQSTLPEQTLVRKMTPKEPGLTLKKKKQNKQPSQYAVAALEKKLECLSKMISKDRRESTVQVLDSKKAKANKVRQRKRPPIVVAQITLNSSDEESRPEPVKKNDASSPTPLLLSDGEADEVIIVPAPPPPKICIDCSDDDSQNTFALPKTKKSKKKKPAKFSSPRCLSPSNSSIMSDDFIGQHDRSRLNDSFTEPIPNDDELECSMEGSHRSGTNLSKKNTPECRQERVPSISSEDTVCTSGDTTDQEKRRHDASNETMPISQPLQPNDKSTGTKGKKKLKEGVEKTSSKAKGSKSSAPASPMESNFTSTANTEDSSKTPSKPKARCKSPATLALELVRKQFETKKTGKKPKSKKETDKNLTASEPNLTKDVTTTSATKTHAETGGKQKAKKNSLSFVDENISSESDYDLLPLNTPCKASTPNKSDKKSASTEMNRSGKRSSSSFFEEIGNVSSESDYEKSFMQAKKDSEMKVASAKESKKRMGRKRKQYNSETYSDEDFACLLTDIVRAVSDTDDDDDDDEDTIILDKETEVGGKDTPTTKRVNKEKRVEQELEQEKISTPVARPKKKKKCKDTPTATDHQLNDVQNTPNDGDAALEPVKKKKKLKTAKSVAKLVASGSTTPDVVEVVEEVTNKKTKQSLSAKKKGKATGSSNVSTSSIVQAIFESDDDDDDDCVLIKERRFSDPGRDANTTSKKPPMLGSECAWNEEMKLFYNDTWADEDFNLKSVLRSMPRDSRQWHIVHKDLYPDPPKREVICNICDEPGHMRYKCRNKPKKPLCYMCGEEGHREPRCPNTICLNCGSKTRSFVRECKMCTREAGVVCFTCGGRGHAKRSCPDLWRRYHSTIEDNVPLREDYERNPKARWCCICCRPGHQAHMCNDAARIFGHAIPNTAVSSYMPAYRGEYTRYRKHQVDEQQRRIAMDPTAQYNLFSSDANECELNLGEVIQNENGFYYRFFKMTGLLDRQKQQRLRKELEDAEEQRRTPDVPMQDAPMLEEPTLPDLTAVTVEPEVTDRMTPRTEEDFINKVRTCEEDSNVNKIFNKSPNPTVIAAIVEENSNYSFSEFNATDAKHSNDAGHAVESKPERNASESMDRPEEFETASDEQQKMQADFIPLTSEPPELDNPPVAAIKPAAEPIAPGSSVKSPSEPAVAVAEVPTDARVFLSKENAKLLLSLKGNEFLNEAGKRHTVKLSITFESVGNVLLISGLQEQQDNFHQELVKFLNPTTDDAANAKYFQMLGPRLSSKMTRYISQHLRFLKAKDNVGDLLAAYQQLNPDCNAIAYEKCRRKLNIQLFGVYGMRDGRKHLNVLRHQLSVCMKERHWKQHQLTQKQRHIIDDAIRYIFSAYDHKDYVQIVKEYEMLRETHQLRMLTYKDLGFETRNEPGNARNRNRNAAPQNNMSKKLQIDVNICNSKKFFDQEPVSFSGDDDFVLNTFDQMIDPIRLQQLDDTTRNVSYDQQWNEFDNGGDQAYNGAIQHNPVFSPPSPTPSPHSNWSHQQSHEWEETGYRPPRPRDRFHWFRPQHQQGNPAPSGNGGGGGNSSYYEIARLNERENMLRDQELDQLQKLQKMLQR